MVSSEDDSATDSDNNSGDVLASNSSLFSEGERVLAYHGPKIYEAKVQKAEVRKKEWRYFVHYLGWNKNWDEWVDAERLMKHNAENVVKQETVGKKQGGDKNAKLGRSAQVKPKSSADAKVDKEETKNTASKSKKRKIDSVTEKVHIPSEKVIKIQIPSTLKKQLLEDWQFVNQQNKLVKLPRSPTVDDILGKYLDYRSKKDGMITDSTREILDGLRCYFDKALPLILLYKKERQQYIEAVSNNVSPCSVYGAEHLLRLFVKLHELLAYVKIEPETMIRLQNKLLDFLKYMQKHQGAFFVPSYDSQKLSEGGGKGKDNQKLPDGGGKGKDNQKLPDGGGKGKDNHKLSDGGGKGKDNHKLSDGGGKGKDNPKLSEGGVKGKDNPKLSEGGGKGKDNSKISDGGGGKGKDNSKIPEGGGKGKDNSKISDGGSGRGKDNSKISDGGGGRGKDNSKISDGGGGKGKDC